MRFENFVRKVEESFSLPYTLFHIQTFHLNLFDGPPFSVFVNYSVFYECIFQKMRKVVQKKELEYLAVALRLQRR